MSYEEFLERHKKRILQRCSHNDLCLTIHAMERLERIKINCKQGEFKSYKQKINFINKEIVKNINKIWYQKKSQTFSIKGCNHYYIISKDMKIITIGECQAKI